MSRASTTSLGTVPHYHQKYTLVRRVLYSVTTLSKLRRAISDSKSIAKLSQTMATNILSAADADSFDYLIVGGGTAGCVLVSRLAEYLPHKRVLLIEAGPSDLRNDDVLLLKKWLKLLGGEYDYSYRTTEQPMGTSAAIAY